MAVELVEGVAAPGFGDGDMLWPKTYTDGLRHRGCSKVMLRVVCRRSRWEREDLLVVSIEIMRRGVGFEHFVSCRRGAYLEEAQPCGATSSASP